MKKFTEIVTDYDSFEELFDEEIGAANFWAKIKDDEIEICVMPGSSITHDLKKMFKEFYGIKVYVEFENMGDFHYYYITFSSGNEKLVDKKLKIKEIVSDAIYQSDKWLRFDQRDYDDDEILGALEACIVEDFEEYLRISPYDINPNNYGEIKVEINEKMEKNMIEDLKDY